MKQRNICNICGHGSFSTSLDASTVNSNVRKWKNESFTVWRCANCNSIHSLDIIDLNKYYTAYPYRARTLDNWTRNVYKGYMNKLKKFGLNNQSTVLDYGCSEGLFLNYLKEKGVENCIGYDPYIDKYADDSVLKKSQNDFVIAQDVIEHAEEPKQLFKELVDLVNPGGKLVIGTPNAEAIDLKKTTKYIHSLHQPYHIHILSCSALLDIAAESNLLPLAVYNRHITDTIHPFTNWTFLHAYLAKQDNTLDAGFEEPKISLVMTSPTLLFKGLFGYFFPIRSEMIAVFQKPKT